MNFHFAYPLLIPVLMCFVLLWLFMQIDRKPAPSVFSSASKLRSLSSGASQIKVYIPFILRLTAFVLLVLCAGRPQLYNVSRETQSPGVDIILCMDTSGSMQALDFKLENEPVMRLTAVKKVVGDFIRKREFDRIGLVVFGDKAFTQAPLTLDKGLLLQLVNGMQIGMAGESTAIGDAIAISAKRLKDLDAPSKILIVLTDGQSNMGELSPTQAAQAAATLGIKIYTIGVGSKGKAPFMVNTPFGNRVIYQRVDLDEPTLREIAQIGSGKYFRASDTKSLEGIYDYIDKAEKHEIKVKEFFYYKELYFYFLIPALLLILLALALEMTILRVLP